MRIERVHISAFGSFTQADFGPFADRVVVVHGPNEAGKSTLHAFIQAILFGFPASGLRAARQVTRTGRYGGRLILRDGDNRRYVVERYLEQHAGAARVTLPDGSVAGEELLDELLAGVSPDLYQSVFAFAAEDLLSIQSLSSEAASGRMYAAGLGVERLPDALERFNSRALQLFDPDGTDKPISLVLHELAEIERVLVDNRRAASRYHELLRRREEISLDIRDADFQISAISRVEQRIADEERRSARAREREERAATRVRAIEQGTGDPVEDWDPGRLRREIDDLRESWTRLQATRRMIDVYETTVSRQRLPRSPWFLALLMTGVLLPVVIGAITGHRVILTLGIVSATLGMITLVLAAIARSRFESAQLQALLHLEMTHREAQGRFLHSAMETRIDPDNVAEEIERLEQIRADILESRQMNDSDPDSDALASGSRSVLEAAHEAVEQRDRDLIAAVDEWRPLVEEFGLSESLAGSPAVARAAVVERRDELLVARGRLDEQIQQLEDDRQGAELRFQREELLTLLGEQVHEWSTNVVAGALIHEAVNAYGQSRQPEVLRSASDAFDAMTLGAYHQLVVLDGEGEIGAIGRDGREVSVAEMSRGTREQAYLALRIGLIRAFGRARSLPVLIDDILVHFDPERAVEAMRALESLTSDHQLFIFTSHPSTVALARFVIPGTSVIALGEQKIAGLAPIWIDND